LYQQTTTELIPKGHNKNTRTTELKTQTYANTRLKQQLKALRGFFLYVAAALAAQLNIPNNIFITIVL